MLSFAGLVVLASTVFGQLQPHPHQAELQAWGNGFVGDWVSELDVEQDVGPLKPGAKVLLKSSIAWSDDKESFTQKFWIEADGKVVNTTKGIVGWDPAKEAVVLRWFNSWGGSGETTYKKEGESWVSRWEATGGDGVKSSWTDVIKCTPNANYHRLTDRVIDGKNLSDQDSVWKRR